MKRQELASRAGNAIRWADKPSRQEILDECHEYAAMGYSRTVAAACLGYSRSHFTRHVLPRIDPQGAIPWPSRGGSVAHQEANERKRVREAA